MMSEEDKKYSETVAPFQPDVLEFQFRPTANADRLESSAEMSATMPASLRATEQNRQTFRCFRSF